jgi:hypothetical protein
MNKKDLLNIVDTLKFYADQKNWQSPSSGFLAHYDPENSPIDDDHGERALKALKYLGISNG